MITVFLLGFGKVGRWVARLLLREYKYEMDLVGVSNSRGTVLLEGPMDKAVLLKLAEEGGRLDEHPSFTSDLLAPESVTTVKPDIAMIALPPSYETGEPNARILYSLMREGIHIVTADKTVLAREYNVVMTLAIANDVLLGYRATVAAGTPVIDVASALRYRPVERVRAVLNATSNLVLDLVSQGYTFEDAIAEAGRRGLLESDPSIDLYGLDAAAKLVILANTLGVEVSLDDVERIPLTEGTIERLSGGMIKQVALLDVPGRKLRVEPMLISQDDPLARARGEHNVVVFELEGDKVVIEGPAGPAWRTARVMIADAQEITEALRYRYL